MKGLLLIGIFMFYSISSVWGQDVIKQGIYTLFTLIFKKFTFMIITFKLFVIFAPNIQIRLDFSNHCNDIK